MLDGTAVVPDCELSGQALDLGPSFFASESLVNDQLEIRLQRGSDLIGKSDGVVITVDTASSARSALGTALPVGPVPDEVSGTEVRISLYLNATCPVNRNDEPVHLEASGGTIVFSSIYAPLVNEDEVETEASLEGIVLGEAGRSATLSGSFSFLHTRGRPAQRYP